MDTRRVTLIAAIAAIALLAVGIGYAYASTVTTTNNDVDVQAVKVIPMTAGGAEKYTGSTVDVQFDTAKIGNEAWKYGISMLDPAPTAIKKSNDDVISSNYQYLTEVRKVQVQNEGDVQKTLTGFTITIKGNDTLTAQLSTGAYKTSSIKAILVDSASKTCILSTPAVDVDGHNLVFSTDLSADVEDGFITAIGAPTAQVPINYVEYTLHFIIEGEQTCTHEGKLSEDVFQIEYKATANNQA